MQKEGFTDVNAKIFLLCGTKYLMKILKNLSMKV